MKELFDNYDNEERDLMYEISSSIVKEDKVFTKEEVRLNEFKKHLFKATKFKSLKNIPDMYFDEAFWSSEFYVIEDIIDTFRTKDGLSLNEYYQECMLCYAIKDIDLEMTPLFVIINIE